MPLLLLLLLLDPQVALLEALEAPLMALIRPLCEAECSKMSKRNGCSAHRAWFMALIGRRSRVTERVATCHRRSVRGGFSLALQVQEAPCACA